MNVEELQIPVPWGHVAAKAWGNKTNIPALMIHGMGDNAGSFDKLIPYLSTTVYYVSIDLPGYGKSSHFPQYLPVQTLNLIFTYKLIVDYLRKDKYIIIGHSWGGRTTILFTLLYPECVLKLILIDPVYSEYVSTDDFQQCVVNQFDHIMKINNAQFQNKKQAYTYDNMFKKIQDGIYGRNLDKEAVEAILKRSMTANANGQFYLTNDPRLKLIPMNLMQDERFSNELIKAFPIACPVLIIIATKIPEAIKAHRPISILYKIKKTNVKCIVKEIDGDHDIHMKQPEVVATLINAFLYNHKL